MMTRLRGAETVIVGHPARGGVRHGPARDELRGRADRARPRGGARAAPGAARSPATVAPEQAERIAIESDADVVTARQRARALAVGLEMPSTDQTLLATAISEIARNITAYAVRGEVLLDVVRDDGGRRGVRVVALDDGPGHRGPREGAHRRLHHRRRPRPRPARRAAARGRVRHRDRARGGHQGHPGQVDAWRVADWPAALDRGVRGRADGTARTRSGDVAVFAPTAGRRAGLPDRRARATARRRPTRPRRARPWCGRTPRRRPRSCSSSATRRCWTAAAW